MCCLLFGDLVLWCLGFGVWRSVVVVYCLLCDVCVFVMCVCLPFVVCMLLCFVLCSL